MVTSRDDLSIAIRSAFLKKGNKQNFSLLALIVASIILIFLESFNWKPLNLARLVARDVIYRTSFIISIPENIAISLLVTLQDHFEIYQENKSLKLELEQLKNNQNQTSYLASYLKTENDKLKKAIDDSNIFSFETIKF